MKPNVFPIFLEATDYGSSAQSPKLAAKLWARSRTQVTWFAVDCRIDGPEKVTILVRGMHDNVYGGIGTVKHQQTFDTFNEHEKKLLKEAIMKAQVDYAAEEWARREEVARKLKILVIYKELFE